MQDMSSTDSIAIHHCNNRLGQTAYLHLHIKYIQARDTVTSHISSTSFHVHISTCTESFISRTSQYNHTNVLAFSAISECLAHLPSGQWRKSIAITFTINGYLCYMIVAFKEDFLEVKSFDFLPFSLFHNYKVLRYSWYICRSVSASVNTSKSIGRSDFSFTSTYRSFSRVCMSFAA